MLIWAEGIPLRNNEGGNVAASFRLLRRNNTMNFVTGMKKIYQGGYKTDRSYNHSYFLVYTACFIAVFCIVFSWFLFTGRTFVWQHDGFSQQYKALVYYGRYLRTIVRALFIEHRFVIPTWDFTIGEGSDIFMALHYNVYGDPLNLLSVIVPTRYTHYLYNFLIFLRMYLAGISFSLLCFETGKKSRFGILTGAMVYVFCYWALFNAERHPYFLTPMIYFPLLILGIERILRHKSPYVLIGAVFLSAISNFYFFYMLVFLTIIYAVVRLMPAFMKRPKETLLTLVKIGGYSVVGVLMSAVILMPVIIAFLSSDRMSVNYGTLLLYPLSYYSRFLGAFLSSTNSYWLCMGFSAVSLPAVLLLFFRRHEGAELKQYFVICVAIALVPFLGQALNGFSYITNRWSWGFALVIAYIVADVWPRFLELTRSESLFLFGGVSGYLILCLLLEQSRNAETLANLGIALIFVFLLVLYSQKMLLVSKNKFQVLLLAVTVSSIVSHSYWLYASSAGNYAAQAIEAKNFTDETIQAETTLVKYAANKDEQDDFVRYSGRNLTYNAGMIGQVSSTSYYWSLANPYVASLRTKTGLLSYSLFQYRDYDDRTALTTLASVGYYITPKSNKNPVPYGFSLIDTGLYEGAKPSAEQKYNIYRNENALPLAYTYAKSVTPEYFETLNEIEKQELLLQAVVVEDGSKWPGPSLSSQSLDYEVICNGNGITYDGDRFIVTSSKATAQLTFEGVENSETYLLVNGLDYERALTYDLYFGVETLDPLDLYNETRWENLSHSDKESITRGKIFETPATSASITVKVSTGISKTLSYYTPYYQFYNGRQDFAVNLDYAESAADSITLTFSAPGIYSFDELSVICQPMDRYVEQVNTLKEDVLEDLTIGTDRVSGHISPDTDKWLCFSIPYSKGWKAYVDGVETELYQANIQYMALDLSAGDHSIELVYQTPMLRIGAVVSVSGFLLLGIVLATHRCSKRMRTK